MTSTNLGFASYPQAYHGRNQPTINPTTINPIFQCEFTPVFVDIDIDTLNLNIEQVEELAKQGAKIITFAHQ